MKRTLGPLALTCIGIGAVIGAGIFSLTGTAAAGQTFASRLETPVINFVQAWISGTGVVFGRAGAGPAIAASFIVAGIACAFAAFCYAELASMIPVSGSAYTYSYATLGEIVSSSSSTGQSKALTSAGRLRFRVARRLCRSTPNNCFCRVAVWPMNRQKFFSVTQRSRPSSEPRAGGGSVEAKINPDD